MEYIIIPKNKEHLKNTKFKNILLGIKGLSKPHNYIIELSELDKYSDYNISICIDIIFHESHLARIKECLEKVTTINIDKIYYSDHAVFQIAKELGLTDKLCYAASTYLTNSREVETLSTQGISSYLISSEITMNNIKSIIEENNNINIEIIGLGNLEMFYSKRKLLHLYNRHFKKNIDNVVYLKEEQREFMYPVIEDENGTYIYRSSVTSCFDYINELDNVNTIHLYFNNINEKDIYLVEKAIIEKNTINLKQLLSNQDLGYFDNKTFYKKG